MSTDEIYAKRRSTLIEALRAGTYKQAKGVLRTIDDRYCCLGVATDVAILSGKVSVKWLLKDAGENGCYHCVDIDDEDNGPFNVFHDIVKEYYGFSTNGGAYNETSLWELNDHKEMSFDKIANIIESNPEGLFV